MKYFLLVMIFILLQTPPTALAKKCKGSTEAACFKPKITWDIKQNEIINVCNNYGYGHWKYRSCRMEAQTLFKQRCSSFKQQVKKSQGKYRDNNRAMAQRYCIDFRP